MLLWRDDGGKRKNVMFAPGIHSDIFPRCNLGAILQGILGFGIQTGGGMALERYNRRCYLHWEVNQDFHRTEDAFIVPEELKSFILG